MHLLSPEKPQDTQDATSLTTPSPTAPRCRALLTAPRRRALRRPRRWRPSCCAGPAWTSRGVRCATRVACASSASCPPRRFPSRGGTPHERPCGAARSLGFPTPRRAEAWGGPSSTRAAARGPRPCPPRPAPATPPARRFRPWTAAARPLPRALGRHTIPIGCRPADQFNPFYPVCSSPGIAGLCSPGHAG